MQRAKSVFLNTSAVFYIFFGNLVLIIYKSTISRRWGNSPLIASGNHEVAMSKRRRRKLGTESQALLLVHSI